MQLNLFSELYAHQILSILSTQIQQNFQVMHFSNYRQDCEQVHNEWDIKYLIVS